MEKERLPVKIALERFAKAQRQIRGHVTLAQMPRLQASGVKAVDVEVAIDFGFDQDQRIVVTMNLHGTLTLVCQNTWVSFAFPVNSVSVLSPVNDESEAMTWENDYEPVLWQEGMMETFSVVEEELLLNLPLVPRSANLSENEPEAPFTEQATRYHPFEILKTLGENTRSI